MVDSKAADSRGRLAFRQHVQARWAVVWQVSTYGPDYDLRLLSRKPDALMLVRLSVTPKRHGDRRLDRIRCTIQPDRVAINHTRSGVLKILKAAREIQSSQRWRLEGVACFRRTC